MLVMKGKWAEMGSGQKQTLSKVAEPQIISLASGLMQKKVFFSVGYQ